MNSGAWGSGTYSITRSIARLSLTGHQIQRVQILYYYNLKGPKYSTIGNFGVFISATLIIALGSKLTVGYLDP